MNDKTFRRAMGIMALGVLPLLVAAWVAIHCVGQPFRIPSPSMAPTLTTGDRILVDTRAGSKALDRGDVIVFRDTLNWNGGGFMAKRIIGMPGDHIACCTAQGDLLVNGSVANENYRVPESSPRYFSARVPTGHPLVMGDNRPVSLDSRTHQGEGTGYIDIDDVVGRVARIYWPLRRAGDVHRVQGGTFANAAAPGASSQEAANRDGAGALSPGDTNTPPTKKDH